MYSENRIFNEGEKNCRVGLFPSSSGLCELVQMMFLDIFLTEFTTLILYSLYITL